MKKIKSHYLFFSLFFMFLMVENSHLACAQLLTFHLVLHQVILAAAKIVQTRHVRSQLPAADLKKHVRAVNETMSTRRVL